MKQMKKSTIAAIAAHEAKFQVEVSDYFVIQSQEARMSILAAKQAEQTRAYTALSACTKADDIKRGFANTRKLQEEIGVLSDLSAKIAAKRFSKEYDKDSKIFKYFLDNKEVNLADISPVCTFRGMVEWNSTLVSQASRIERLTTALNAVLAGDVTE